MMHIDIVFLYRLNGNFETKIPLIEAIPIDFKKKLGIIFH